MMAAIREIVLEVYTALPKGHPGPAMDFASELPGAEAEPTGEQRKCLDQVCQSVLAGLVCVGCVCVVGMGSGMSVLSVGRSLPLSVVRLWWMSVSVCGLARRTDPSTQRATDMG
jgi:hypothetical protein